MGKGRRHPAQARESLGQPVGAPRFDRSEARPSRPPDVLQGAGRPHRALALYRSSVLGAVIIAVYATTIVIAAAHHEGHPILWYVILRYSYFVFGSTAVLPVASVLIAIAAIVVFVTQARLPLWLKAI